MDVNFLRFRSASGGNGYNRIVEALVYIVVVLLPLFYLPFTSSVLEYNKQVLLVGVAAVGLVLWLLGVVVSGKLSIRTTVVDKGVFAVLLACGVATAFSLTRVKSLFGLNISLSSAFVTVAALSVFYFLVVNIVQDRGRMLRSALSLSVMLALALGLAQMMAWYFLPGSFTHTRTFTTVGSFNVLGVIAAVFLALFAKTTSRAEKFDAVVAYLGVGLSLGILAILNWWVLWAIALAGMLATIAFDSLNATQLAQDYGGGRGRFALGRFVIPMTVLVLGAFLLLVGFNPASLKKNFPVEVAPSYRLSAHVAKEVVKQRMLYGYGPENFSIAFDRFGAGQLADSQLSGAKFYDATSEVLNTVVHGGAIALLALLLLFWCLAQVVARFSGAISESVARGESASFAYQATGTLSAMVAMVAAMFLYPFNMTLAFLWFGLLALSALAVSGDKSKVVDIEEKPMYALAASLAFIVGLIGVLTALYFMTVMYLADVKYDHAVGQKTPAAAMDGLAAAISLNSNDDRYLRDASQVALLMLRDEVSQEAKKEDTGRAARIQNILSSAVQLAQRATVIAPEESLNWSNLGDVYQALTGLVDNVEALAADAYKKASDLRPGDPSFDNKIGAMWLARADLLRSVTRNASNAQKLQEQISASLSQAEIAFKNALDKSPTYGLAIYNLGAVYDRQGRVADAIKQLEKILPYNADQPTLMFEIGLLYIRAGDKNNALAAMQRAVLLAPKFANARWYLALLLEERGDIDGALAQLRAIQEDNPDNKVLADKIAQLEAGQRAIPPAKVIDSKPIE